MHPDDGLLVAYIRHQPCDGKHEEIQRHIENCTTCQSRSAEYERTSQLLEAWSRIHAYRAYPSLTERVMQRARSGQGPKLSARVIQARTYRSNRISWRLLSLPLAVLLLLILSVVITLAHLSNTITVNPRVGATLPVVVQTVPDVAAPPAHQVMPTTIATTVLAPASPTISECTSTNDGDTAHSRIRICGVNFTPKSRVYLILTFPDGHTKARKSLLTDGHGQFQDVITITRCKDVPVEIVAHSVTKKDEQSPPLGNIQFGDCPVPQATTGTH